jgi:hypothetical protein
LSPAVAVATASPPRRGAFYYSNGVNAARTAVGVRPTPPRHDPPTRAIVRFSPPDAAFADFHFAYARGTQPAIDYDILIFATTLPLGFIFS